MGEASQGEGVAGAGGRSAGGGLVVPAAYSGVVAFGFHKWIVRPMFRKGFHAVRILRDGAGVLGELRDYPGPVIGLANHPSWWDPLLMVLMHERELGLPRRGDEDAAGRPARHLLAPIDRRMLEQFGFLRKLGCFGVLPQDPASTEAMGGYVLEQFRTLTRPTLWATPEGRFTDVRERPPLRPGVAAIAARAEGARVVCAAVEYAFWTDKKPEAFVAYAEVERPEESGRTTGWLRAIRRTFAANQDRLAEAVIARDPARFRAVAGGDPAEGRADVHPVYGLWLRVRGKSGRLTDQFRAEQARRRSQGQGGGDGTGREARVRA